MVLRLAQNADWLAGNAGFPMSCIFFFLACRERPYSRRAGFSHDCAWGGLHGRLYLVSSFLFPGLKYSSRSPRTSGRYGILAFSALDTIACLS